MTARTEVTVEVNRTVVTSEPLQSTVDCSIDLNKLIVADDEGNTVEVPLTLQRITVTDSPTELVAQVGVGTTVILSSGLVGPQGPAGADGVSPVVSDKLKIELTTLTATEITNKQLTLGFTPSVGVNVTFWPTIGPAQEQGIDYFVTGSVVSWAGTGLDVGGASPRAVGDVVLILYVID